MLSLSRLEKQYILYVLVWRRVNMGKFFGKLEGFYIQCDLADFLHMTEAEKKEWAKKYCPWCWYNKNDNCMCYSGLG